MTKVINIDGNDVRQYATGMTLRPSGQRAVGVSTLDLAKEAGGLTYIRNMAPVEIYELAGGNVTKAWFGGFVSMRDTGNVGDFKLWQLDCQDYNVLLDTLWGGAAVSEEIVIAPGLTIPQWLDSMIDQLTTGATSTIDVSTHVEDLLAPATLPFARFSGKSLRMMLQHLVKEIRLLDPTLHPGFHLAPSSNVPRASFGGPCLYFYDRAATPTPSFVYSDNPGVGEYPFYGEISRKDDATRMRQWQQSQWLTNTEYQVFTASDATSITTYPNPYSKSGGWEEGPIWDRESANSTDAQAVIDDEVERKKNPRETVTFEVQEDVLPGMYIELNNTLESWSGEIKQIVEVEVDLTSDPITPSYQITCGSRKLRFGDEEDDDIEAAPVEGDNLNPLPPTNLTRTASVYVPGNPPYALETLDWDASPSVDVANYEVLVRIGDVYERWQTAGSVTTVDIQIPPATAYTPSVRAYDSSGNASGLLEGTLLVSASADVSPVILNASFELGDNTQAPNWVYNTTGTGDVAVDDTGGGAAGHKYLLCDATGSPATATATTEEYIEAVAGRTYVFGLFGKASSAISRLSLRVHWYTAARAFISAAYAFKDQPVTTSWSQDPRTGALVAPATTAYCKIEVGDFTGGSAAPLKVDLASIQEQINNDLLAVITDPAKIALYTSTGGPRYLYDSSGVIRGKEYYNASLNIIEGVNTGATPTGVALYDSGGLASVAAGPNGLAGVTGPNGVGIQASSDDVTISGETIVILGTTATTLDIQSTLSSAKARVTSGGEFHTYDGTRWLGPEIELPFGYWDQGVPPYSTSGIIVYARPVALDQAYYLTRMDVSVVVVGTNNGSNYWTIELHKADDGDPTLGSTNTSTYSAGSGLQDIPAVTSFSPNPLATDDNGLYIKLVKTGTPGTINPMIALRGRRVY